MMRNLAPKTLYISPAWQQHDELITHLSKFSQNILLMIAPQKGGKTTFLEHFINLSTPTLYKKYFKATPFANQEMFLKEIVKMLDLTWEGLWQSKSQLKYALEDTQDQTWVLFIDDAHLLSNEQLQILIDFSHFEEEANNQLHLVLLGEPSLELKLFSPELAILTHGKIYTLELESWTHQDISNFLAKKRISLNEEQIATVLEKSGGLPGEVISEINALALNVVKNDGKRRLKFKYFHPISFGILAGVIIGGSYLLLNNNSQEEGFTVPMNAAQFSESSWQEKEISPQKTSPVAFHFDKIDTTDVVEEESQKEFNIKPQSLTIEKKPKEVLLKSENNKKLRDPQEKHLLSMNKHHYTLQLLGANHESTVKQFIKKYALEHKTYSFKTKRQGKDWYVVVYGDYPSRQAAKAAVLNEPTLQQANIQPWVREVSSIHQDIHQG